MKKAFLSVMLAVSLIGGSYGVFTVADTTHAAGGCQAFGHATRDGAPWGASTKAANAAGDPGVIAANTAGAHAAFCP